MSIDLKAALDRVTIPPIIPGQARMKFERSEKLRELIITFPMPLRRIGLSAEKCRELAKVLNREADALETRIYVPGGKL